MRRPDAVPARPRPDRPLEAVPPAEGEDAGLHRPAGRPLPDADDAHAGDDGDLAGRRPRAAPERGLDRGDRARARPRAHAVRPRRRGRARPCARRAVRPALPAQRAVVPDRPRAEPDPRGLRGDPHAHGDRRAGHARGAGSSASSTGSRTSTTTSTTRSATACSRDDDLPAEEIELLGPTGAARIDRLVHDLVETSAEPPATSARARRSAGRCTASATSCSSASTSPSTRRGSIGARTRRSGRIVDHLVARGDSADEIVEYVAGMTDRFALAYAEKL